MDWSDHRIFLELLRAGSFSGAARATGLTHATLRRRLEDMERRLDLVLFVRSHEGLKPTAVALKLQPAAIKMEAATKSLLLAASAEPGAASGTLRISTDANLAVEVLPPALAILRARLPDLKLEMTVDQHPVQEIRGGPDILVQSKRPLQSHLHACVACGVEIGLFAHADYVARAGQPRSAAELRSFSIIGSDTDTNAIAALRHLGVDVPLEYFRVRTDSLTAQQAAVRAAAGIGGMHVALAHRDPNLIRILPDITHEFDVWIAAPEDRLDDPRIRIAFDVIADHLAAYGRETRPPAAL